MLNRPTPPFVIALFFFAILFMIILSANAQLPPPTLTCKGTEACVRWAPSAGWNNGPGKPITPYAAGVVVSYNVYSYTVAKPARVLRAVTQGTEVKITGLAPGETKFVVKVLASTTTSVSDDSPIASKIIRLAAPTDGKIERPTDGGIENSKP